MYPEDVTIKQFTDYIAGVFDSRKKELEALIRNVEKDNKEKK